MEDLVFHPQSKAQSLPLAFNDIQWKGETAGDTKLVGIKEVGDKSFIMSVFQWLNTSFFGRNDKRKETRIKRSFLSHVVIIVA